MSFLCINVKFSIFQTLFYVFAGASLFDSREEKVESACKQFEQRNASKAMANAKQSRCVIGVKGQTPDSDYPVDIWFDSLRSDANVLSKENQQL